MLKDYSGYLNDKIEMFEGIRQEDLRDKFERSFNDFPSRSLMLNEEDNSSILNYAAGRTENSLWITLRSMDEFNERYGGYDNIAEGLTTTLDLQRQFGYRSLYNSIINSLKKYDVDRLVIDGLEQYIMLKGFDSVWKELEDIKDLIEDCSLKLILPIQKNFLNERETAMMARYMNKY